MVENPICKVLHSTLMCDSEDIVCLRAMISVSLVDLASRRVVRCLSNSDSSVSSWLRLALRLSISLSFALEGAVLVF